MAEIYSLNIETGEVFIRALPGEDLSGWTIVTYDQSGNGAVPVDVDPVVTSTPYGFDPDDGNVYYLQVLGPLRVPSGQRDALTLVDDTNTVVDAVGWGKDEDFDLVGGPGDGISISDGNGNYAPGDGPWYTDGPPWETAPPPESLEPLPPPCFVTGTLIDTPNGPIAVESLRIGNIVLTLEGPKPMRWIGSSKVRLNGADTQHLRPVRFSTDSLGIGQPTTVVLLSQQHRVFLDSPLNELHFGVTGVLVPAKHMVNNRNIIVETGLDEVEYFHLLLDEHQVVVASGLRAETLLLSEWVASGSSLKAMTEFLEIFPSVVAETGEIKNRAGFPILKKHEAMLVQPRRLKTGSATAGLRSGDLIP